jgi:hypothetical protein
MIRLMLVGLVKPPILVLFRTLIMLWLRVSLRSWNSFKVNVLGLEKLLNIGTLVSRVLFDSPSMFASCRQPKLF